MKKKHFLLTVLSAVALSAISIIQFNSNSGDDLLEANVEVLAWQGSDGGDGGVHCTKGEKGCTFQVVIYDENGNILRDPEGNPLYVEACIPNKDNLPPQAQ